MPPTALILEDEPRFRDFLAEVVAGMDCTPVTAATASEALRQIDTNAPDLLLLDLNLPVTDGMTFLDHFRRICPTAPVIIITGFGDLESAKQAIRHNITEFLTKPCDLGQLEQAISRARLRLNPPSAPPTPTPYSEPDTAKPLAIIEREAILSALRASRGNRSTAAKSLGISRRSLYDKITEYERQGCSIP